MTTVIYNDVVLRDCDTQSFEQRIEYDESNTDVMFSRFKIRVASTLVAIRNITGQPQFGIDTLQGSTVVQREHDVRSRLSEPRGDLWFLVDNNPQNERQGLSFDAPILDQPLLIATGKPFTESITIVDGKQVVSRGARAIEVHPLTGVSAATNEYGPGPTIDAALVADCENGPKPTDVSIVKIMGGRSLRVEFEIEVCVKLCKADFVDQQPATFGDPPRQSNVVLSNRWSLEESKNENWITTRTMQGTLRVSHSSYWPHAMRYLCIPPLLRGYRRARQSFVDDPTGLVLKYRIEDEQAYAAPPYPAIAWKGHHGESASGPNGTIKTGEFHIRLTGPMGVDKQQLIGAAGKVAVKRIRGLAPLPDTVQNRTYELVLLNASIIDSLDEPTIEMRVQVQYTDESYKSLGLRLKTMGRTLDELGSDTPQAQWESDGTVWNLVVAAPAGYSLPFPTPPDAIQPGGVRVSYDCIEDSPGSGKLDQYSIDGYDPQVWPVPLAYDSETPAGIFSCYLQHSCSVWKGMPDAYPVDGGEISEVDEPEGNEPSGTYSKVYNELHFVDEDAGDEMKPGTASQQDQAIYDFPYTWVELQSRYVLDNGWIGMPVADSAATKSQELIKLHPTVANRVLTMSARRDGRQPTIPSLKEDQVDHNGNREVLKRIEIIAKAPTLGANNQRRTYEFWCEYTYLIEKAPSLSQKLRLASSPLDTFTADTNWIDLSSVVDNKGHLQWEAGKTTQFPAP